MSRSQKRRRAYFILRVDRIGWMDAFSRLSDRLYCLLNCLLRMAAPSGLLIQRENLVSLVKYLFLPLLTLDGRNLTLFVPWWRSNIRIQSVCSQIWLLRQHMGERESFKLMCMTFLAFLPSLLPFRGSSPGTRFSCV
jgi:hypothetical protein